MIVGRDATLVVEGHFRAEGAALEVEVARRLSRRPIRAAVDTHFHLDHTFGNIGYEREGIPIIAHERVPALMQRQYRDAQRTDHTAAFAPLEEQVTRAGSTAQKKRAEDDLGASRWMYGAIDSVQLAYPTELVRQSDVRMAIDLGGIVAVVECRHGHTPGDVTVTVLSRDVAFVGDLLFQREYPVCIDADNGAASSIVWRGRAARCASCPDTGPSGGRAAFESQAALMDDLRRHAERMKKIGATAEEAERRYVVPARFGDYEIFAWSWTIGAALRSLFAAL